MRAEENLSHGNINEYQKELKEDNAAGHKMILEDEENN